MTPSIALLPNPSLSSSSSPTPSTTSTVLVTGGSGFVGSYVVLALLSEGYTVRATLRSNSPERQSTVRQALANGGATANQLASLQLVTANLESDDGWAEVVKGCTYVHHVASPFPAEVPIHENELIVPAREGTLRVLKAAAEAGVKRVVLTSSFSAIENGHGPRKTPFSEKDWTVLDDPKHRVAPYVKSKTIAEKAAWEFIKSDANKGGMELSVVIPVLVTGPALSQDISTSILLIKKLIDGSIPGAPKLSFPFVDVRDIASLHMFAMLKKEAANERFIGACDGPPLSLLQVADIIRTHRPNNAKKAPHFQIPNLLVFALGAFDKSMRVIIPDLGKMNQASNVQARKVLGWQPRGAEQSLVDTVDSLVLHKLV